MNKNIVSTEPGKSGDIMIQWEGKVLWINAEEYEKIEKDCYNLKIKLIAEYLHKRGCKC